MAIYQVYQRAGEPPDRVIFVREGFSGAAMVFSLFWALWRRMWIVALLLVLISAAAAALGHFLGFGDSFLALINLAAGVVLGLEADRVRGWSLTRSGYREVGIIEAGDSEEAELKFFMDTPPQLSATGDVAPWLRPGQGSDPLGLFGTV